MRADLHTHSRRSDGTDTPAELIAAAEAAGLDVVALTDHDCTAGWAEAEAAAADRPIELVRGLEISCRLQWSGVHLLAYEPDPTHPGLLAELDLVLRSRTERLPRTLELLGSVGVHVTEADVAEVAGDAVATGRPHVADALVALGHVADRDEAFARYLSWGRPAYVDRYAADLASMIALVTEAGGAAVIAHPWARGSKRVLDAPALRALRDVGLVGIECDHQDHTPADRAGLHALADRLDLVATGSSDYHGTGKVDHDLGCHTTPADQLDRLRAVWESGRR